MKSLACAGVLVGGFAAAALPAAADQRTITVTLLGGKTLTVTVPAGTPLDQLTLPPISTPIVGIVDSAAAPTASPVPLPLDDSVGANRGHRKAAHKRPHRAPTLPSH